MRPLETEKAPVEVPRADRKAAHWVKPQLVAEIAFTEFTNEGILRHPSYTGMLVVYLGAGVALDSWLSVAAAVVPPAAAVVNRIRHEERLLRTRLGERYVVYASRTRRLVPGVW